MRYKKDFVIEACRVRFQNCWDSNLGTAGIEIDPSGGKFIWKNHTEAGTHEFECLTEVFFEHDNVTLVLE